MAKKDSMVELRRKISLLETQIKTEKESSAAGVEKTIKDLEEQVKLLKEKLEAEEAISAEKKKQSAFQKQIGEGLVSGNLNLTQSLQTLVKSESKWAGVAGYALQIASAALKIDTTFSDIATSLDVSVKEARQFAVETKNTSEYAGVAGTTYLQIAKTAAAIRSEFGFITDSLQEDSQLLSVISKNLGVSSAAAGKFALASEMTGVSTEEMTKNLISVTKNFPVLERAGIRFQTIISDIASLSKDTLSVFAGQTQQLLKSVVGAKALGINLNQAKGISLGLLDIEQSLRAEAEARVLTGQNLNFDQARYLAVTKDIQGASAEVLRQVGGIEKFSQLNLLAQESIADAVGISVGDLAESLTKQKAIAKLGADQVEQLQLMSQTEAQRLISAQGITDASVRSYITSQSQLGVQERFNDMVTQIQEILVTTVVPFLQAVTPLLNVVGSVIGFFQESSVGRVIAATAAGAGAGALVGNIPGAIVGGVSGLLGSSYNEMDSQSSSVGSPQTSPGAPMSIARGVPELAEGGIVSAPTQVIVGDNKNAKRDPEVIAPLSKLKEIKTSDTGKVESLLRELISIVKGPGTLKLEGDFAGQVFKSGQLQNSFNMGFEPQGGAFS